MSEARKRSPKAPSIDLEQAIQAVRPVFEDETRNKMSRLVLANHLGYSGLSGASASKIGALRHFGLVDGREDELRVSELAIDLLMHGVGTPQYKESLRKAFAEPNLFKEILEHFEAKPSTTNLEYWLVQRGVQKKSAERIAEIFLRSAEYANIWSEGSTNTHDVAEGHRLPAIDCTREPESLKTETPRTDDSPPQETVREYQVEVYDGERELMSGLLSKETEFRLVVRGPVGVRELDILIRKLELDKEILSD